MSPADGTRCGRARRRSRRERGAGAPPWSRGAITPGYCPVVVALADVRRGEHASELRFAPVHLGATVGDRVGDVAAQPIDEARRRGGRRVDSVARVGRRGDTEAEADREARRLGASRRRTVGRPGVRRRHGRAPGPGAERYGLHQRAGDRLEHDPWAGRAVPRDAAGPRCGVPRGVERPGARRVHVGQPGLERVDARRGPGGSGARSRSRRRRAARRPRRERPPTRPRHASPASLIGAASVAGAAGAPRPRRARSAR